MISGLLLLVFLCWVPKASADTLRRNWYFEQLAQPPEPTHQSIARHHVSAQLVSYPDALSLRFSGLIDLDFVEVLGSFSQRLFLSSGPTGLALQNGLAGEVKNFTFEVARFRANAQGAYGRLGIGLVPFLPQSTTYGKFTLSTGRLPSAEVPWELRLAGTLFLSFNKSNDFTIVSAEVLRHFTLGTQSTIRLGGFATWGQAIRTTVRGENTLLSLGPNIAYKSILGLITFALPLRIWLDINPSGGFLSDFSTPAFSLGWQYSL